MEHVKSTGPVGLIIHTEPLGFRGTRFCPNGLARIFNMAVMPMYGTTKPFKFFSSTRRPIAKNRELKHLEPEYNEACLNDDLGLAVIFFTTKAKSLTHRRRKRGGQGGQAPPIIWEGGPTYPLAPPIIHPSVPAKLFLSILSLNFLYYHILRWEM